MYSASFNLELNKIAFGTIYSHVIVFKFFEN